MEDPKQDVEHFNHRLCKIYHIKSHMKLYINYEFLVIKFVLLS